MTTSEDKLTTCRAATTKAILDVAEKKFRLELVRKDRSSTAGLTFDAAQAYRTAEATMQSMIESEIKAITKVVMERHEKKLEDVEKSTPSEGVEPA